MLQQANGSDWYMANGDCCELIRAIPDRSIGYSIFSPPFSSLYVYSDSERDMGNCKDDDEFFQHFAGFLVPELYRVIMPGRLCSIHCMDLPSTKQHNGYIGLRDFPAAIREAMEAAGWIYHSKATIWKDPVQAMQRTKALGLLHKQIVKDSSMSRQGIADYVLNFVKGQIDDSVPGDAFTAWMRVLNHVVPSALLTFRHPEKNPEPIAGELDHFVGDHSRFQSDGRLSIDIWQRYASPVWDDINPRDTLNATAARDTDDERHICVASGSLVLTERGYRPIETIEVGEKVLTHAGRWKSVLAKRCNGIHETIRLFAQGVPGLSVTPDHNIWTRIGIGPRGSTKHPRATAMKTEPKWIPAKDTLAHYVNLPLPPVEETPWTELEWWIAGRWLADGHWDKCARPGIHISCGAMKYDALMEKLGSYAGAEFNPGTVIQIRLRDGDGRLRDLISRLGRGASGKTIPREALSLDVPHASSLLDGYFSGDGHFVTQYERMTAESVSRGMLLGLAIICQRVHGVASSVYAGRPAGVTTIQGRQVNTKDSWVMAVPPRNVSGFVAKDGAWKKVRKISDSGLREVWDLQIEDDQSFIAEGCSVHNCPLQLSVIQRGLQLWSNPGDVVLSPFAGVGSEGVGSLREQRKFIGFELKPSYFQQACRELRIEEGKRRQKTLDFA